MSKDSDDFAVLSALDREVEESLCAGEHAKTKTVLDGCLAAAVGDVVRQRSGAQVDAPAGMKWMQLAAMIKATFHVDTVSALLAESIIRLAEQQVGDPSYE